MTDARPAPTVGPLLPHARRIPERPLRHPAARRSRKYGRPISPRALPVRAQNHRRLGLEEAGQVYTATTGEVGLACLHREPMALLLRALRVLTSDGRAARRREKDRWPRVRAGTLHKDLFHRLDILPSTVPRRRAPDGYSALGGALSRARQPGAGPAGSRTDPGCVGALCYDAWPGKVRARAHIMRPLVTPGAQRMLEVGEEHALLQESGGRGASRVPHQGCRRGNAPEAIRTRPGPRLSEPVARRGGRGQKDKHLF